MSSAFDPQEDRFEPTLPEAWLGEVFATAGEGRPQGGSPEAPTGLPLVDGEPPSEEQLRALRAARGHLRALRSLPSLAAPEALEGRVVASLEAGFRQDRAAGLVSGLERRIAPEELAPLVGARVEENLEGVGAPAVLERLVGERVAAPEKGMIQSMARRLDRKAAPLELDERVLESASASSTGGRVRRFAVLVAAAATVLVAVRLVVAPAEPGSSGPALKIIRVDSLESVSASALDRAFLGSLTGEYPGGAR
jgi:hypothetical protein